jgi:hypothetical protein
MNSFNTIHTIQNYIENASSHTPGDLPVTGSNLR